MSFLQECKLSAHVRTANLIVRIGHFQQRNNQLVPELIAYFNKLKFQMAPFYKNQQHQDHLFCALHKYIWHSIIEQGKSWETKTKLEQVATSLETVLVPPEGIKTKRGYVSAMKSKTGAKPAPWSLDKRLTAYYIVGFVNQKQKAEFCLGGNQAAQTQNQNLATNANLRLSKLNISSASGDKLALSSTKCFNCQKTGHYSQNCPNPENKRQQGSGNGKNQ